MGKTLEGRTVFITGASRGIGRAIALRAARDGANLVIAAKTAQNHPTLPGTIYSVAREVEAAGGRALPCIVNVRFERLIEQAVARARETFGGIDALVHNAGALQLTQTLQTPLNRFDLVHNVNLRGLHACVRACLPALRQAHTPQILVLAPPLNLNPDWLASHLSYTLSKYGASMSVLGMAEEFRQLGIAVNALWPRTGIATSAVRNLLGGEQAIRRCRTPEIVADAAHALLLEESPDGSGRLLLDEDVLRAKGVTDFSHYAVDPTVAPMLDFFVDA
jgi:citronellol/citronellal dehydrogenase